MFYKNMTILGRTESDLLQFIPYSIRFESNVCLIKQIFFLFVCPANIDCSLCFVLMLALMAMSEQSLLNFMGFLNFGMDDIHVSGENVKV